MWTNRTPCAKFVVRLRSQSLGLSSLRNGLSFSWLRSVRSAGVVASILLSGCYLFGKRSQSQSDVISLTCKESYRRYAFHDEFWGAISHDAKKKIYILVQTKPDNHFAAELALQCSWMTTIGEPEPLPAQQDPTLHAFLHPNFAEEDT